MIKLFWNYLIYSLFKTTVKHVSDYILEDPIQMRTVGKLVPPKLLTPPPPQKKKCNIDINICFFKDLKSIL